MEVHHHPDLHHKSKPWKEYILEFIMIFLAVSMGYIAESFRESRLNQEKELRYAESLVRDLKEEKKGAIQVIKENKEMMVAIDTFVRIRSLDFTIQKNNILFFKLLDKANLWRKIVQTPNEITLNQIKATGGLNIIRPKIANLITELDISNQHVKSIENILSSHNEEAFRMIYEIVDYPALWNKDGSLTQDLPFLIVDDKKKLIKYFNLTADVGYTIEGYINTLNEHLIVVDKVTQTLEKEYNLDK